MRANTKSISIHAPPDKVWKFLTDLKNLPRWAVGFAKNIRNEGGRWIVTTGAGEMGVRLEMDARTGVVDFYMSPGPGVEACAPSRVIANDRGSEYLFTQFRGPEMPDDVFEKNVKAVEHELTVLRALLEVECPL